MDRAKIGISDIFALYILVWSVTPIMASGTIYRVLLVFCAGAWVLVHLNFFIKKSNMTIGILLLVISTFVLRAMNGGIFSGISWTINMVVYCMIAVIGAYYLEYRFNNMQLMIIVMLICTSIIAFISIKTVIVDPTALRLATHEWDQGAKSYGAYDYVYMCVQGVPIFLVVLRTKYLRNKEKFWTVLNCATITLYCVLIVLSGFTLANVITLAGLLICILLINPSSRKTIAIFCIAVIALFSYKYILQTFFSFLLDVTEDAPMYTRKIQELYSQIMHGSGVGASYGDRVSLYADSWNAIVRYPIFGSILISGKIVGGGHSTYVDVLAYGGIIYAFMYYWQMIVFPIKLIKSSMCSRNMSRLLILIFLTTNLLTGIFDTITYAYAWIWFLLIPYIAKKYSINSNGGK